MDYIAVISAFNGLSPLTQLFAAIYFSLCFEGLASRLYRSKVIAEHKEDSLARLAQGTKFRWGRLMRECDFAITKFFCWLGLLMCISLLLVVGVYPLAVIPNVVYDFFESYYWLIMLAAYLPSVFCWLFFDRPNRYVRRAEKIALLGNMELSRKKSDYLNLVLINDLENIDDAELRSKLMDNSESKSLDDYYADIEVWEKEKINEMLDSCAPMSIKVILKIRDWFAMPSSNQNLKSSVSEDGE